MSRILFLEDDKSRQRMFRSKFIGHVTEIVETAESAIRLLSSNSWDILFLDHDLGGEQMVASGPGTGYEVACWLSDHPEHKPTKIIIHSFNPVGAARMKAVLPEASLSPGCWT